VLSSSAVFQHAAALWVSIVIGAASSRLCP
jgi:hypothetical protein